MAEIKEEFLTFISKIWVWILYVLVGLMCKYSLEIRNGKKMTLAQALAGAGIAFFVGFIASVICIQNDMEKQGMWIVPLATLVSDKIVLALMAIDYKETIGEWFTYWSNKFKK